MVVDRGDHPAGARHLGPVALLASVAFVVISFYLSEVTSLAVELRQPLRSVESNADRLARQGSSESKADRLYYESQVRLVITNTDSGLKTLQRRAGLANAIAILGMLGLLLLATFSSSLSRPYRVGVAATATVWLGLLIYNLLQPVV